MCERIDPDGGDGVTDRYACKVGARRERISTDGSNRIRNRDTRKTTATRERRRANTLSIITQNRRSYRCITINNPFTHVRNTIFDLYQIVASFERRRADARDAIGNRDAC